MKTSNRIITGLIALALGLLFVTAKGNSIKLSLFVFAGAVAIMAIVDIFEKQKGQAFFKALCAVAVFVLGLLFVDIVLYLISACIIIYGVMQLFYALKTRALYPTKASRVIAMLKPVATLVAGAFLIFNKGAVLDWVFVVAGVIIAIEGLFILFDKVADAD